MTYTVTQNQTMKLSLFLVLFVWIMGCSSHGSDTAEATMASYTIHGKIQATKDLVYGHENWLKKAHVFVNGGTYITVPDRDGSFQITGLKGGSYVVEVSHPTFVFPPARVDINSKGKMRARKLNNIQPNKVEQLEYPLVLKAQGKAPYFQKREEWRITDMLMNPMVLMMVLPMVLIFIMPKMMNAADEETKKEMEASMSKFSTPSSNNMPDLSQTLTNWLGGGVPDTKQRKKKSQR